MREEIMYGYTVDTGPPLYHHLPLFRFTHPFVKDQVDLSRSGHRSSTPCLPGCQGTLFLMGQAITLFISWKEGRANVAIAISSSSFAIQVRSVDLSEALPNKKKGIGDETDRRSDQITSVDCSGER